MLYWLSGSIALIITLLIMMYCLLKYKNLLSPSVELSAMYCVSLFCFCLYANTWETDLYIKTIFVITVGIVCFVLGEMCSNKIRIIKNISNRLEIQISLLEIGKIPFFILTVASIVTLVLYFRYSYDYSVAAGNKYGYVYMLTYIYYGKYNLTGLPEEPVYITLGRVITQVFAMYSFYVLANNTIIKKFRAKYLVYIIPIVIYVIQASLSGGRTQYFRLLIQMMVIALSIYSLSGSNRLKKVNYKQIVKVILLGVCFLIMYRLYGVLRGSVSSEWDNILSYPGTTIEALNYYLVKSETSQYFGEETLMTINGIINKFGFDLPVSALALPSVTWTNGGTNVYTALRRYIADYTVVGMCLIQFMQGFFYGSIYKRMRQRRTTTSILVYAYLIYPVVESIFEERFLIGVCSAGTIYVLVCIYFMNRIVHKVPVNSKMV